MSGCASQTSPASCGCLHPAPALDQREQELVLGRSQVELLTPIVARWAERSMVTARRQRRAGAHAGEPTGEQAADPERELWGENGLVR